MAHNLDALAALVRCHVAGETGDVKAIVRYVSGGKLFQQEDGKKSNTVVEIQQAESTERA